MLSKIDANFAVVFVGLIIFIGSNILILVCAAWIKTKFINGKKDKGDTKKILLPGRICTNGVHCPEHTKIETNVEKLLSDVKGIKTDITWLKDYLTGKVK